MLTSLPQVQCLVLTGIDRRLASEWRLGGEIGGGLAVEGFKDKEEELGLVPLR